MSAHQKASTIAAQTDAGRLVVIAQTTHVDLTEAEGDPIDDPCQECGAQAGEQCRPLCIALPE